MATQTNFRIGDYVWVNPEATTEFDIPSGAKVLAIDSTKVLVQDVDGKERCVGRKLLLKNMHVSSIEGVDDMINLGDLQEYAILRNLHLRYINKLIYTYTGTMLVAVNPYEILPIYTNNEVNMYRNKEIGSLPPHIFAIGDGSYNDMRKTNKDQCIVISGESGAGKTESTKLILQYLATVSGQHSWIEQQILESNPLMEAFGNAKTIRNDNSSRFGKYININFNKQGSIESAKITQYLLEKSRIVSQSQGERNYHIFYSMLAGLTKDEKKQLDLGDASDYNYLTGGDTLSCTGRNEVTAFADIKAAMKVLNFKEDETWNIFQLLAASLHLGNVKVKAVTVNNMESSEITDSSLLGKVSQMLGANKSELNVALTKRSIVIHGEKVISNYNKEQALQCRDAFVKGLYGKLFIKIIDKINEAIDQAKKSIKSSIGVLDIFGFEKFDVNSFEQMCINYANENLQQFFVHHIFKMEQEYYTKEGISWQKISFVDNQVVLDMIGMKPMNILSLIDEETKFPKGTDLTLLTKLHSNHKANENYLKPKSDHIPAFGIKHFAGPVNYNVAGFLDKNRDTFSQDLKNIIVTSSNSFLKHIFSDELTQDNGGKRIVTLSAQFRSSLDQLMKALTECHPFFIRCIKPNENKAPLIFDRSLCCRQLRYSGLMETAKIRKAGYPIRYSYSEFVGRFRHLGTKIPPAHKTDCKEATKLICSLVFTSGEDYQMGHSRVFLKEADGEFLEQERDRVFSKYVVVLQRAIRGWIYRRRFQKLRQAAIVIQKHWRARGYRTKYLIMRNGYQRLQAIIRSRVLKKEFQKSREVIHKLQPLCKGYVARKYGRFGKIYSVVQKRRLEEKELKAKGDKNFQKNAEANFQKRMIELGNQLLVNKAKEEESANADKIVDDLFNFINDTSSVASASDIKESEAFMQLLQKEGKQEILNGDQDEEAEEDLSAYNFRKFAATYFVKNTNPQYSKKPLKESLLDLPTPDDIIAAQALWITILRFMGDLAEPKFETQETTRENIMTKLSQTLSRSFTNRKEFKELMEQEKLWMEKSSKKDRHKLINMTLKHKSKLLEDVKRGLVEDNYTADSYKEWLYEKRSTNMEKLHFILGHGILRPELRDEIFCQICKQLTNNPSKASHARGWILLSLCVGCFPPSPRFVNYLRAFIRDGPPGYAPYCEGRLNRTFKNGPRTQPPSWLELQAVKNKNPINLVVTFMDGSSRNIEVDSATTSEEVCESIANSLNLKDKFGFSLFITLYDKVMSLGSEHDHIMDAISQCEQYAKEQGKSERSASWRLFFRKEIFTPWHDPSKDTVSTNLIYHQIIRGLRYGEYRCNTENDVTKILAQQYYIDNGPNMDVQVLESRISEYIPSYLIKPGESLEIWVKKLQEAFSKNAFVKKRTPIIKVKEDIVNYSKVTWPILFSKFYEAIQKSGPELPKKNMIIAVNWTGIYMIDDQEQILLELTFTEVTYIGFEQNSRSQLHNFTLKTIRNEEYVFQSPDAENLSNIIIYLLDGLKKRSIYCVATQDYKHPTGAASFLTFKKGDLIVLKNNLTGEAIMSTTWGYGESGGKTGDFPTENVQILPAITEPSSHLLKTFKKEGAFEEQQTSVSVISTIQRLKMHTLAHYANEHFRSGKKLASNRRISVLATARSSREELWKFTNEPLHQPLLEKLLPHENECKEACKAFTAILKYMGDLPAPKAKVSNEYTDEIFSGALRNDMLKDEIYCQIMKQLTYNRLSRSEEKGWELLYLATGLFICSTSLMIELQKFLKTRIHPLAQPCLQRLQRTQKVGTRRFPPHSIEVDAIQRRSMQIYHKIYFPDDTDEAFEIDSHTKASDLCAAIVDRLELNDYDGFSLFIIMTDRVFSIPEEYFFYDFLHELLDWFKQTMPSWNSALPVNAQYHVYFMKKLWINTIPGQDINADQIFHFHQEVPKFLRGYHKCTKHDAIQLAALIFKVKYNENVGAFSNFSNIIKGLVPNDMIKAQSTSDWKKSILNAYQKISFMSPSEAKSKFLEIVFQWPTFGSTFFEVKQTTEPTYPEIVIIAINKKGVNIIHPQTKDILVTYGFSELYNWSSGNTYFHLTVGSMMRATKILCETSQGYKMDDLLTSYTDYIRKRERGVHL
ncbi:myosin-VIIa-like [Agrilus planipennis]|uniref:Myosin-VIIa-like n=1 Tax=Agrilus planipennis TaxID=224129 RepID=A0A1W4X3J6_AGRPL|nr:myosin-VIIa-like [Agrilus planipennis]